MGSAGLLGKIRGGCEWTTPIGTMISGESDNNIVKKSGNSNWSGRELTAFDRLDKEIVPIYDQRKGVAACPSFKEVSKQYMGSCSLLSPT